MSMRIVAHAALGFLLLLSVSGCTVDYHAAPPVPYDRVPLTEREWAVLNNLSKQLDQTRKQLADTRAEVASMRGRLNAAEGAVEEIRSGAGPGPGSGNVGELQRRLAALELEVKTQRELLKVREDELRLLRDAVLKAGEEPATPVVNAPEAGVPAAPVSQPAATQGEAPAGDRVAVSQRDYEDAWKRLRARDYRGAIERFKKFVEQHPDSNLTDNAQYWIGESYYALREYDEAILEFDVVRTKYPDGDKVPAAWLKIGYAFAELGNRVDARLILQEVINRYPRSKEAEKAREKIRTLDT
jgi:tol-pal system protein YbgF